MGLLFRVVSPRMVAGFVIEGDKVTLTAPILAWLYGKSLHEVMFLCRRNRWNVTPLEDRIDNDKWSIVGGEK